MKTKKPTVCLIDESGDVAQGWESTLGTQVCLLVFSDPFEFIKKPVVNGECLIIGRSFSHLKGFELLKSSALREIRSLVKGPIFLNWQGYIPKEELETLFDGKIFHKYGIKWSTLRMRIQKSLQHLTPPPQVGKVSLAPLGGGQQRKKNLSSKDERCQDLLKLMASRASYPFKEKMIFFAYENPKMGRELLEAIYNRLLTERNLPENCPSQYINSSPRIAVRILQETLSGSHLGH
jgi:hypothetical protein